MTFLICTAVSSSKSSKECYFSRLGFCYKLKYSEGKRYNPNVSFFFFFLFFLGRVGAEFALDDFALGVECFRTRHAQKQPIFKAFPNPAHPVVTHLVEP